MEWTLSYQPEHHLILVQTHGTADEAGSLAMSVAIKSLAEQHQVHDCLIDHRQLDGVAGNVFDVYDHPQKLQERGIRAQFRIAEVARPEHLEFFRFMETVFRNRGIDFMVFTDEAAARRWLKT